jgi:hypothetical protein
MKLANTHALRAYDAVQLAVAVELNSRWLKGGQGGIVLVSADDDLKGCPGRRAGGRRPEFTMGATRLTATSV